MFKTVILGLGKTGLSCVRYLKSRDISFAVTDSRESPPGLACLKRDFPEIPVALGGFSSEWLESAEQLVISPGISCTHPLIKAQMRRGVCLLSDVDLFVCGNKKPILAVTGSNGKTTVVTLLGRMIEAAGYTVEVCGNIGQQMLDVLDRQPDFYVVELSSFQLELTHSLAARAAVILNVTPDHMDRYKNFAAYLAAKQMIYRHCQQAIINLDDRFIWQKIFPTSLKRTMKNAPIGFTLNEPKPGQFGLRKKDQSLYLARGKQCLLSLDQLALQGLHHYQNALAALSMGDSIGLPMRIMLSVLQRFRGIPHRCEFVIEKKGVRWFNDSKATNVGAVIAAVKTVSVQTVGRLFLIAGGDAKGADLSGLKETIRSKVDYILLLGRDAKMIAAVVGRIKPFEELCSLEAAVSRAAKLTRPGDTVLLSPACASFDMFENYEQRGHFFIDLVKQLPK